MLKIILLSALAIGVTMLVIRKVPSLRVYAQRLLQNPIDIAILLRGLMLLIRLLIFRWSKKAVSPEEYPENHCLESFYG